MRQLMTDKPDTGPRTFADEEVAKLWEAFKSGGVAHCPRDNAPLALAVDAAAKSYRLVCTRCGSASLWFETAPTGIHIRSADDQTSPGVPED
jgi:hypothetical protein